MSLRFMNCVWESKLPSDEKFVALALADHANEIGGSIYPSLATVARKTSKSERQVRRIMRKLEARGVITLVWKRPGRTSVYQINADALNAASPDINVSIPRTLTADYPGQERTVTPDTARSAESTINHHKTIKVYGTASKNPEWADQRDRRRLTDHLNQLYAANRGNVAETDEEAREQHRISASEIFRQACRRAGLTIARGEELARMN